MTGISKYCTIQDLEALDAQEHLINCVIDRSGADIRDYDVVRQLEKYINGASADFEGEMRRYRSVPFDPTITSLTGLFFFERGSEDVIVTGADLSEFHIYDEIRPDLFPDLRMIVKEIGSDTDGDYLVCFNVFYHEYDIRTTPPSILIPHTTDGAAASKYDFIIPKEVRELVAGHCAFTIWERRAKGVNNPRELEESRYRTAIMDIREGLFRFDRSGTVTHKIPAKTYDDAEKVFTDKNLSDYRPGDPEVDNDED